MPPSQTKNAERRAAELYELGFAKAAIDVLDIALLDEPLAGRLWRLRAVFLARTGRHEEAFANVQEALALSPLSHEELLILAAGYARRGLDASAGDVFAQLAADPAFPLDLWEPLCAGLCAIKRWHAALTWLRRVARRRSDDDRVYFAMAQVMRRLGRPAELVLNVLRKAVHLNGEELPYRLMLAGHLARMGRTAEGYREIAAIRTEKIGMIGCRCCMQNALQLCIDQGDGPRAAAFAMRLAELPPACHRASEEKAR